MLIWLSFSTLVSNWPTDYLTHWTYQTYQIKSTKQNQPNKTYQAEPNRTPETKRQLWNIDFYLKHSKKKKNSTPGSIVPLHWQCFYTSFQYPQYLPTIVVMSRRSRDCLAVRRLVRFRWRIAWFCEIFLALSRQNDGWTLYKFVLSGNTSSWIIKSIFSVVSFWKLNCCFSKVFCLLEFDYKFCEKP